MPTTRVASAQADRLAGQYRLHPGQQPGISGGRPVLDAGVLARLLQDKPATEVPRQLSLLFTLCAHAHRRTAALAIAAALDAVPAPNPPPAELQLCLETARDHLRSMALDWMQRSPDSQSRTPDLVWLKDCPLALVAKPGVSSDALIFDQLTRLKVWVEDCLLQQPIDQWLQLHHTPEAMSDWCHAQATRLPPAKHLARSYGSTSAWFIQGQGLNILNPDKAVQTSQLTELAQTLASQSHFAQCPTWRGQCCESGSWTRLRHRSHGSPQDPASRSMWSRMAARWLELLALANVDPGNARAASLLSSGALHLAPDQAIAWCEMARGLLLHWVQLDAQGVVQDYRVLAPTEWNFHPHGALAQAVAALKPHEHGQALLLADAFDPCVSCTVER